MPGCIVNTPEALEELENLMIIRCLNKALFFGLNTGVYGRYVVEMRLPGGILL
jgi:hypothetical protein